MTVITSETRVDVLNTVEKLLQRETLLLLIPPKNPVLEFALKTGV